MWNKILQVLQVILNISEVWAILIPLLYLSVSKVNRAALKEIILYLWIALLLNLIIVILVHLPNFYTPEQWRSLPLLLRANAIEYNLHSIIRVILFTFYFLRNSKDALQTVKKLILVSFLSFAAINFIFFESPITLFSSRLFAVESVVMLFFCIYYYLNAISEEKHKKVFQQPMFWIVAGLSIYEAVSFCIFLTFTYLIKYYTSLAQHMWNFHNLGFIIFCLFITKGFYESKRQ